MKDIQSTGKIKALFLLMRPSQWVKNIILFLPLFFAQEMGDTDRLRNVAILFASFCLLTSGVYIFNDLMDADEDRLHPVKRFRPIASRKVTPCPMTTGVSPAAAILSPSRPEWEPI